MFSGFTSRWMTPRRCRLEFVGDFARDAQRFVERQRPSGQPVTQRFASTNGMT